MHFHKSCSIGVLGITLAIAASSAHASKLYFADERAEKIQRANLDGTGLEDLITDGIRKPRGIALDIAAGKIYWADEGNPNADDPNGRVMRANLDGSDVETLVAEDPHRPHSIALDIFNGKMYWTDEQNNSIRRANLDGSDVEDLIASGISRPKGIALDLFAGKMYWTDEGDAGTDDPHGKVRRANLDGSDIEDLVTGGLREARSIALDLGSGKMYWTDEGDAKEEDAGRIRRANLDGSDVETLVSFDEVNRPRGIALDLLDGHMYWTGEEYEDHGDLIVHQGGRVRRADLDGANIEDLVTGMRRPAGVALDLDECDIGDGTSEDCNENGTPDECDIANCQGDPACGDCNGNDIPDECDIADCQGDPNCGDCNDNGIPDACDIANGSSEDCNENGIPDECDIENCDGDPSCGDCNNNGVPDFCDIRDGTSQDVEPPPDGDGIPDECSFGENPKDNLWATAENWFPPIVPDNTEERVFNVNILGEKTKFILNIDAEIDSLRLLTGSQLEVTMGNLTIETPSGLSIEGILTVDQAFSIKGSEMKVNGGQVIVSDEASIDISDTFTLDGGGIYQGGTGLGGSNSASLTVGDLVIQSSGNELNGQMILSDAMSLTIAVDIADALGTGDMNIFGCPAPGFGGCTPPIFEGGANANARQMGKTLFGGMTQAGGGKAEIVIEGSFFVNGIAQVKIGPFVDVLLSGNFDIQEVDPALFDWANGSLLMNGADQIFEVAGEDFGPTPDGFIDNYAMGTIEVSAGTHVTIQNEVRGITAADCAGALYVHNLILRKGSSIRVNITTVYYENLIDEGAEIDLFRCSKLIQIED